VALTPKQEAFVREYLVDLNATQAAIRAGYSQRTANEQGARLLANVSVRAAIEAAQAERAERVGISADAVLEQWWTIATADPADLIDLRRTCCRHCYGEGHNYQRTEREMARDRAAWEARERKKAKDDEHEPEPFDEAGGTGYDARRDPHPGCPECFGEGGVQVVPKDIRHVPPAARLLYAGVKQTRDGIEIKMRDQDGALVNVAKHLGMFVERVETRDRTLEDMLDSLEPEEGG